MEPLSQYDLDSLEHESGLRPLGEYPDHCERCRLDADRMIRQAACEHADVESVSHATFGYGVIATTAFCMDCGLRL